MSATSTSAVLGRRTCAALAATSAVLHAAMVGDAGHPVVAVLIVGMALACLYCAKELWTAGSPRVWCIVAVMNLGMVAVHWSMPGHHHGQTVTLAAEASSSMPTLMVVATSISVVEAVTATVVLWVQTRSRASSLSVAARSRGAI